MHYKIPTFNVKMSHNPNADPIDLIDEVDLFNRSIVQFILNKIENPAETRSVICYIINERRERMTMVLEKVGWLKSINKALEYFEQIEEYETCDLIKQIKESIK